MLCFVKIVSCNITFRSSNNCYQKRAWNNFEKRLKLFIHSAWMAQQFNYALIGTTAHCWRNRLEHKQCNRSEEPEWQKCHYAKILGFKGSLCNSLCFQFHWKESAMRKWKRGKFSKELLWLLLCEIFSALALFWGRDTLTHCYNGLCLESNFQFWKMSADLSVWINFPLSIHKKGHVESLHVPNKM